MQIYEHDDFTYGFKPKQQLSSPGKDQSLRSPYSLESPLRCITNILTNIGFYVTQSLFVRFSTTFVQSFNIIGPVVQRQNNRHTSPHLYNSNDSGTTTKFIVTTHKI